MKASATALALGGALLIAAPAAWFLRAHRPAPPPPRTQGPLPGNSLYQLASEWTTDAGEKIRFRTLEGSVLVVALIFTHCPSACPTLVRDMRGLQAALPPAEAASTRFVLVSIDPERDTPEVLRAYRRDMGLESSRWVLLRGSAEDVRELAAVLGAGYAKPDGEEIMHANLVTVLDAEGRIVHHQAGVAGDPDRMAEAIAAAQEGN